MTPSTPANPQQIVVVGPKLLYNNARQAENNNFQVIGLLMLDLQTNKSEGVLGLSQDRKNPVKNSNIKLQAVCFQLQQQPTHIWPYEDSAHFITMKNEQNHIAQFYFSPSELTAYFAIFFKVLFPWFLHWLLYSAVTLEWITFLMICHQVRHWNIMKRNLKQNLCIVNNIYLNTQNQINCHFNHHLPPPPHPD